MDKFLSGEDETKQQDGTTTMDNIEQDAEHTGIAQDRSTESPADAATPEAAPDDLETRVIAALRTVYDPEIPVNIYDLGLIYNLDVDADGDVKIRMTLTSPMCPVADILPHQVENVVLMIEGVRDVDLELVWEPPWHPGRLSDDVKLELGLL